MNRVALLAVAASLAVAGVSLLAACGGTSNTAQQRTKAAGTFVRQVTLEFSRGQSGRLWDQLLGSDQTVVSRSRFVECQANTGWNLKSLKILDGYDDAVAVGAKTVSATAVTRARYIRRRRHHRNHARRSRRERVAVGVATFR